MTEFSDLLKKLNKIEAGSVDANGKKVPAPGISDMVRILENFNKINEDVSPLDTGPGAEFKGYYKGSQKGAPKPGQGFGGDGGDEEFEESQTVNENLTVDQLAHISDEALDDAYHYGRSSPGNTFGWQANLKSAEFAKRMIDAGSTDIEEISDAVHKGWNVTAKAFVKNPDQFDDTAKLKAADKLEAKLEQRKKLMNIDYSSLPEEEKEKDRVVARALLKAITGQGDVSEGTLDEKWSAKYKKSINCSNPKGFSQKAHCAGKKKKSVDEGLDFKSLFKKKSTEKIGQLGRDTTAHPGLAMDPRGVEPRPKSRPALPFDVAPKAKTPKVTPRGPKTALPTDLAADWNAKNKTVRERSETVGAVTPEKIAQLQKQHDDFVDSYNIQLKTMNPAQKSAGKIKIQAMYDALEDAKWEYKQQQKGGQVNESKHIKILTIADLNDAHQMIEKLTRPGSEIYTKLSPKEAKHLEMYHNEMKNAFKHIYNAVFHNELDEDMDVTNDETSEGPYVVGWNGQYMEWYGNGEPGSGDGRFKAKGDGGAMVAYNVPTFEMAQRIAETVKSAAASGGLDLGSKEDGAYTDFQGVYITPMKELLGTEELETALKYDKPKDFSN